MKTFILKFSAFVCVALLLSTVLFTASCKKDKPTTGNVKVVDTAGHPITNATVTISSPPSVPPSQAHPTGGDKVYTGTTNGDGLAVFAPPLPAIWDIKATSPTFVGMTGKSILRLDEPGKADVNVTVTIKP